MDGLKVVREATEQLTRFVSEFIREHIGIDVSLTHDTVWLVEMSPIGQLKITATPKLKLIGEKGMVLSVRVHLEFNMDTGELEFFKVCFSGGDHEFDDE